MISKQTLTSKISIVALAILLLVLGNLKFKQWQKQAQIDKEKQNLVQQADQLTKKNQELSQSLQYLNSPSFKERAAREQLDLKKSGEQVYSFSPESQVAGAFSGQEREISNAKKWWDYFFTND